MGKQYEYLSMDDATLVVRLLSGLAEHRGTPPEKRRFLLEGLCTIVQAQVWLWNHVCVKLDSPNPVPVLFSMIDGGWTSTEQRNRLLASIIDPPTDRAALEMLGPHHVTRTRRQLVGDHEWFGTPWHAEHRAPTGLEDFILSIHPAGAPDAYSGIGLHRRAESGHFSDRDRAIVHLVLSEVGWLHRIDAVPDGAPHGATLSTRQRQVLMLLLSGDSRKQIASRLRLSEHTVGDHIKSIHRHYGVSSRGELMSRFLLGGPTVPLSIEAEKPSMG